ncbi:MAG: histidine--tRNA ligase [Saprospirales bacterium]|nr:MAG: histidine--tRNA ligase [Saprospirales bacterium]
MKPSLPKGTRDFGPLQIRKRNYIFDIIKDTFETYGYQPIETPAMEKLETLMGKYGDEGDQLLFKVLNNGDFLSKADQDALSAQDSNKLLPSISKRGLRYDLTVPFARFLSMNRNDLPRIFKRYQIQPVWRADRPQKGRFQEFYQCDADVAGSDSLVYETELMEIYDRVFDKLGIEVTIRVNHRKILAAIAELAGLGNQFIAFTTALDKWDKIGKEGFDGELKKLGCEDGAIEKTLDVITKGYENGKVKQVLESTSAGAEAVKEINQLNKLGAFDGLANKAKIDLTLARGLTYYTGLVFEVEGKNTGLGSLGGGGRYDDLTGIFDYPDISGVGISFGAERIFETLEAQNGFPEFSASSSRVLFMPFDEESLLYSYNWCTQLRNAGIPSEVYPSPDKLKKQFRYAEQIQVPKVALVGEKERTSNVVGLKDQKTGEQRDVELEELMELLK